MTTDSTKLFMCPDMESIVLAYKTMKGKKNILKNQWLTNHYEHEPLYIHVFNKNIHHVSKKPDTFTMSHNSSENQTVSMIYDTGNCPSTLDTLT